MNGKRYLVGSIVIFVYIFIIEWLFHGLLMRGWYNEHLELLRPEAEAGAFFIWMILGLLLFAFGFCFIFIKGYENKGIGEGFRYGLYVGLAFAVSTSLIEYSVFPYPGTWVIGWIIGYLIIMILAGMIFSAIYRPRPA
ncbi:MAG: hypothetical protein JSV44_02630 [Candidatus Zixiibacteriota bacterium]|nr:MAG: hypothetical protein JSV44_02630 [candidate division Zixibacteria bacterium]